MPICKTCGTKFHACSSCGLDSDWEYHYCGYKCRDEAWQPRIQKLVKELSEQLTPATAALLLEVVGEEDDFVDAFHEALRKKIEA